MEDEVFVNGKSYNLSSNDKLDPLVIKELFRGYIQAIEL